VSAQSSVTTQRPATTQNVLEPLIDLHRLSAGIRWRRRLWVTLALVGGLLGAAIPVLLPSASATTTVYVVHEQEGVDSETAMKTDLALLETTAVAAAAATALRDDQPPEKFLRAFSGVSPAGNILQITATGANDQQAMDRAKAVADAFITQLVKRSDDDAKAQVDAYVKRADEVRGQLASTNAQLAGNPAEPVAGQLRERQSTLGAQAAELDKNAEEAKIGYPRVVAGTQVIDGPRVTSRSLVVSLVLYGLLGLIAGLGLGLGLAAVISIVRDRPVLRRDIAAHLGASVIAQVPAAPFGPAKLWRRSRTENEARRTASTLARVVRAGTGPVSLLELGCPRAAAGLATDLADELGREQPVLIVNDLPGDQLSGVEPAADAPVRILPGTDYPGASAAEARLDERTIGVATVAPGTPWTDLRRLGAETVLVVAAGRSEASWLHTVARQLADSEIAVVGVVVVHPDPRDRSDGTLWDALNTAVRGRLGAAKSIPVWSVDRPVPHAHTNGHVGDAGRTFSEDGATTAIPVLVGAAPALPPTADATGGDAPAVNGSGDPTRVLPVLPASGVPAGPSSTLPPWPRPTQPRVESEPAGEPVRPAGPVGGKFEETVQRSSLEPGQPARAGSGNGRPVQLGSANGKPKQAGLENSKSLDGGSVTEKSVETRSDNGKPQLDEPEKVGAEQGKPEPAARPRPRPRPRADTPRPDSAPTPASPTAAPSDGKDQS
jgi:hypothetical protein